MTVVEAPVAGHTCAVDESPVAGAAGVIVDTVSGIVSGTVEVKVVLLQDTQAIVQR